MEFPVCNLCGSTERDLVYEVKKKDLPLRETFSASKGVLGAQQIVRCKQCRLVYVCPRPDSGEIVDSYTGSQDELYVSQAPARLYTFRKMMSLVSRYAETPGRLLDIGAAAGFFCKAAEEYGWSAIGVEPSMWLANWGSTNLGVTIRVGTLQQHAFRDGEFDVVTMWDSIEHLTDPLGTLHECRRILAKHGLLIINTPNIGSVLAHIFRQRWWFLLSHHLYYFTPQTISALLEMSGFETIAIKRHWQWLNLGHLAAMTGLYSRGLSRVSGRFFAVLGLRSVRIPYYASQMNVIAKAR